MNKRAFLTALSVLLSLFLAAATKTDWQEANLRGRVRSIKSEAENPMYDQTVCATTIYNQQGYVESITTGNGSGFGGDERYTYDAGNRLLTAITRAENQEETYRITRTYDDAGLLIKEERWDGSGTATDLVGYNANQQKLWVKTSYDGRPMSSYEYAYDASGNMTSEKYYDEDQILVYHYVYAYDKANLLTEKRRYGGEDREELLELIKYDFRGLVTDETSYTVGEIDVQTQYTYDSNNNLTLREEHYIESDYVRTMKFVYIYDEQGNWLSSKTYLDGSLEATELREITYY